VKQYDEKRRREEEEEKKRGDWKQNTHRETHYIKKKESKEKKKIKTRTQTSSTSTLEATRSPPLRHRHTAERVLLLLFPLLSYLCLPPSLPPSLPLFLVPEDMILFLPIDDFFRAVGFALPPSRLPPSSSAPF
jgi:hypothetical protein